MSDFLVFQLYGAMAAWGDIAVGEQRPTTSQPSKSAILGLIAAALGIRRDEDDKHTALAEAYGFAVRVDGAGVMLRDYHTTQEAKNTKRLKHLYTRRDELADKDNTGTILSSRDYRCDGVYTVCLWEIGEQKEQTEKPPSLTELRDALCKPKFTLYLGRKSCPLALPVVGQILAANTIESALQGFDKAYAEFAFERNIGLHDLRQASADLYWDEHGPCEDKTRLHTTPRNDVPLSRRRWQFGKRNEHYRRLKGEE
jgi:CRISPR system Cascade subunit CasD